MNIGLINIPTPKWNPGTGRQVILKGDFAEIQAAILQSFGLQGVPATTWVDATSIKVAATADDIAAVMMCGFPSVLHPGRFVSGGLTDGRYRENTADVIMDFDLAANFWGSEKVLQWYAIYGLAGNTDAAFIPKAMPAMRVKSQGGQVISLGNLTTPSTGIGYGVTTDQLVGTKIYFISGASKGLIRTISANNNDNGTGGTITYSGSAVTLAQGDWFYILPNTNFRLIGEIFNDTSSNIVKYFDTGSFIQWGEAVNLNIGSGTVIEDIRLCSPLAREARSTLANSGATQSYIGHPSVPNSYYSGASAAYVGASTIFTLDFALENCKFLINTASGHYGVGYKKPY